MIYNQWYAVLSGKEVKKGKILGVKRLGEKMIFFRDSSGQVQCIADKCCHRGASLSIGRHCGETVACPFHGIDYNGNGKAVVIPANGHASPVPENFKVKSYSVQEAHGFIWLWYGDEIESLPPLPFFEELDEMSYSEIKDPWPVHYSRCIENQLDAPHVPFVHRTTIGRGNKTVIDRPKVVFDDETLTFYIKSHKDDGKIVAMKPSQILQYKDWFSLQFRFPNIWQNLIAPKMRVFAAFVPVDEENSVVYIRYYQGIVRIPLLRELMNFSGKAFSKVVLRQDKNVVQTQLPKKTGLYMQENLFPGDSSIIEYRKIRHELKEHNGSVNKPHG